MRNLIGMFTARRCAAVAVTSGVGVIAAQVQEPLATRQGPVDRVMVMLRPQQTAACEGVMDTVVSAVGAAVVGGAVYYGYTQLSGAPLSSGGVPPIGQIDEMVGEPMIYKEALTAINRGDFVTAVKFLTTAADAGSAVAALKLSEAYYSGTGTEKDDSKGLALLTQAAHAGHPVGLVRLGSCYDTGEGVETDIAKANGYFQAAYDRGSPHGAFLLSWSYNVGEGVPQDINKAKALLQFAISKLPEGDRTREKAQLVLDKLEAPVAPAAAVEEPAATEASA